jgi:hypothetical protein
VYSALAFLDAVEVRERRADVAVFPGRAERTGLDGFPVGGTMALRRSNWEAKCFDAILRFKQQPSKAKAAITAKLLILRGVAQPG